MSDNTPATTDPEARDLVELSAALHAIRVAVDAKIKKVDAGIAERRDDGANKTERGRFGSITFANRAAKIKVTDNDALIDWLDEHEPEAVVDTPSAAFTDMLNDGTFRIVDGQVVDPGGDPVDWAEPTITVTDHDAMISWMDDSDWADQIVPELGDDYEAVLRKRLDTLDDQVVDTVTGEQIDFLTMEPGTAYVTHRPDSAVVEEATEAIDRRVSDFARALAEQVTETRPAEIESGTTDDQPRRRRRRRSVDLDDED